MSDETSGPRPAGAQGQFTVQGGGGRKVVGAVMIAIGIALLVYFSLLSWRGCQGWQLERVP